ncbi:MAG: type I 3-dehydroquinate dehydratase [Deltaproteobacteria bacterium]|nr:type I 3-dehydroquinate dehydratase [Deltaproteobacteria bacterium]
MKIGKIELGKIPVVIGTLSGNIEHPVEIVNKIDLFELRIDTFKTQEVAYISEIIHSLKSVYGKPLLVTIRSKAEGGAIEIDDDKRYEIYKEVLSLVDAVDIELSSSKLLKMVLPLCREKEKALIASYHNHDETPEDAALEKILSDGKEIGADIVKIAVTANSKEDLSRLISFTIKNRDKGIITISQGSIGTISRIVTPILGSLMTYGYIDAPSARGQLSAFDIVEHLRLFDPAYNDKLIERTRLLEGIL